MFLEGESPTLKYIFTQISQRLKCCTHCIDCDSKIGIIKPNDNIC